MHRKISLGPEIISVLHKIEMHQQGWEDFLLNYEHSDVQIYFLVVA